MKNYKNWSAETKDIAKIKVAQFFFAAPCIAA